MMVYKVIITFHKEWVDNDIETTKRTFSMKTDPPKALKYQTVVYKDFYYQY